MEELARGQALDAAAAVCQLPEDVYGSSPVRMECDPLPIRRPLRIKVQITLEGQAG